MPSGGLPNRFKDEPFHDVMATFLRGFDRVMQALDTKKPENPVAVRTLLADRIRRSWNFKRLGREKGFRSETHAGDALNAMIDGNSLRAVCQWRHTPHQHQLPGMRVHLARHPTLAEHGCAGMPEPPLLQLR